MKVDLTNTAARIDRGQYDAFLIKICEQTGEPHAGKALNRFLRGDFELVEVNKGYETDENGIIVVTLTPHGHTGPEQEKHLKENGHVVTGWASQILNHKDFTTSPEGQEIKIGILPGTMFTDKERTIANIREKAEKLGLETPTHDIGGLLREHFTDEQLKEMGFWGIPVMSEPVKDSVGNLCSPGPYRFGDSWLDSWYVHPDCSYDSADGFAFVFPQQF